MFPEPPQLALVLGSGLSALAERVEVIERICYAEVPGLAATTVPGHRGRLTYGRWAGKRVLVFEGRLHFYEGHPWRSVLVPAHVARQCGAAAFLTTNAAGGIRPDLVPGRVMALTNHQDWTRTCFWSDPVRPSPYSPRLHELLREAGGHVGLELASGSYAQVTGPCYETPAEIRALRHIGIDAVGMSTAREIEAAFELGLECAALSCITNRAAGLDGSPLSHDEVLAMAQAQSEQMGNLLEAFLTLLDLGHSGGGS